jgi:pimeloyl-ACP methyl ester carboxylesterase
MESRFEAGSFITPVHLIINILFMHENAGNIGLRLDYFKTVYHHLNANIVTFANRGYSRSEGKPTEIRIKMDAEAIPEFVSGHKDIDKSSLFLVGRSLGGAVSVHTATKYPHLFRGIVLEIPLLRSQIWLTNYSFSQSISKD